jgi:MYXO-CTERM domain-containing protein
MVAGIGASLLMAGKSEAAYTGITFEIDTFALNGATPLAALGMPAAFRVYNIYATTSLPTDQIIGVIGSPEFPFSVFVQGQSTSFVNLDPGQGGGDQPPTAFIAGIVPASNWDSFYTLGAKVREEFGVDPQGNPIALQVPPGVPGPPNDGKWGAGAIGMNMAWVLPPTIGTPPIPPPSSVAGADLRVLIMRLVVANDSKVIQGSFGVLSVTGGTPQDPLPGSFKTAVTPAPGALALLGLAGLAGFSRRRRG